MYFLHIDLWCNTIQFCPETCDNDNVYVELPNDTITEYITDTVYVELTEIIASMYTTRSLNILIYMIHFTSTITYLIPLM